MSLYTEASGLGFLVVVVVLTTGLEKGGGSRTARRGERYHTKHKIKCSNRARELQTICTIGGGASRPPKKKKN